MNIRHDRLLRFIFEEAPVRGQICSINKSWTEALEFHPYPPIVKKLLGELMVSAALLATNLKEPGKIIVQTQTEGAIKLLVVECDHEFNIRGYAQTEGEIENEDFEHLFAKGYLVITLKIDRDDQQYQGYVSLTTHSIAQAIEDYLTQSEQLDTRLWIANNASGLTGFMLQKLPAEKDDEVMWEHITKLAETMTDEELLTLPHTDVLHRLYHQDPVRIFEPHEVKFNADISRERMEASLKTLSKGELDSIIEEQGHIKMTCQFTGREEVFHQEDVDALFREPN